MVSLCRRMVALAGAVTLMLHCLSASIWSALGSGKCRSPAPLLCHFAMPRGRSSSSKKRSAEPVTGIGGPKWRTLFAVLLLNRGQVVSTDRLIDELWGDEPPAKPANLVATYVHRLRGLIGDPDGRVLVTRAPGYRVVVDGD